MSDINELNEKIAELEKQRDALAEKTGGFEVGDKVVIEGVVSEIEDSYSHPLKVKMSGGKYGYFRPNNLRHADAVPFYRLPLYHHQPEAKELIAELQKQTADKQAHILRLEEKLSAQRKVKAGLHQAICDRNARIKELEENVESEKETWRLVYAENQDLRDMIAGKNARIALLQDWLAKASAFKSKPTCDTTCDTPDECCNTKPTVPATTVDGDCDSLTVAPKGVKDGIEQLLDTIHFDGDTISFVSKSTVDGIREALDKLVELPEPSEWAVSITRLGVPPTEGCGLKFQGNEMDIAAALVQAAKGGAK